jgi:hypothetical protein
LAEVSSPEKQSMAAHIIAIATTRNRAAEWSAVA